MQRFHARVPFSSASSRRYCGAYAVICAVLLAASLAQAQAPGVPIERGTPIAIDKNSLQRAQALRNAGKLLDQAKVVVLLRSPEPRPVELPKPSQQRLAPHKVFQRARAASCRIGWLCKIPDENVWELNLAGGYAIADEGIVATAAHVLEPLPGVEEAHLLAMTVDGELLPIKSILAVDNQLDAAVVHVEGFRGKPLALNLNISPGDAAYCFSDPLEERGYFSTGSVNRFYWDGADGGNLKSLRGVRNLRFDVTTEWAPGSSGAAVLDRAGNAIGHVWSISGVAIPLDEELPPDEPSAAAKASGEAPSGDIEAEAAEEEPLDEALFQLHTAIPARGVRLLVEQMSAPQAKTTEPAARPASR